MSSPTIPNPNRQELEVTDDTDSASPYYFTIAPGEKGVGKMLRIEHVDWEPVDGKVPWRAALHPFSGGLGPDRIAPAVTFSGNLVNRPAMSYAKAAADASTPNYLTASPAVSSFGSAITEGYLSGENLRYGSHAYGTVTYMGAAPSTSDFYKATKNFNGKAYFAGGQYVYSVDADLNYTLVKDFGAGVRVYDMEPFKNELVFALGESTKMQTMSTAEVFTTASDNTFAIALAAVDEKLWRANSTNLVSSCITAPLTLASWGTDYTVGNTTWSITDLIEFGGVVVPIRPDGVFFPDQQTVFHNQTPQLKDYPHPDNGIGAFIAFGSLFIPSIVGMLEVNVGSSIPVGPELAFRPDFRLRVRTGVEWGGSVYLVCTDEANVSQTFICKMMVARSGQTDNPYIYHEWCRFSDTVKSYVIIVYVTPTNPVMLAGHGGNSLNYWIMGRGPGLDVDDSNYEFATTYELETGDFVPTVDRGIQVSLTGVKVIGKQPAGSSLDILYDMDRSGTYLPMRDRQDGGGTISISTSGFFTATRYAPPNTFGHIPRIKLSGEIPADTFGTDRPEIYEAWAFGEAHPDSTEVITIGIYADRRARVFGLFQGRKKDTYSIWRKWSTKGTTVKLRLPEFAIDELVYARITEVKETTITVLAEDGKQTVTPILEVTLRRIDFTGALNG